MFHFRVLSDRRIQSAIDQVEKANPKARFLDIIAVIFEHLPEILLSLGDPMALVKLLLQLLAAKQATGAEHPAST